LPVVLVDEAARDEKQGWGTGRSEKHHAASHLLELDEAATFVSRS
jgi:hypothetical protein